MRQTGPGLLEADSDPNNSDFAYGFARWTLSPDSGGTRFELTAELKPAFWVPPVLGPMLIEKGLRKTALDALQGVEREAQLKP